jgi:hypothetical protein
LTINPNGTFVLIFPTQHGQESGRIWWVKRLHEKLDFIHGENGTIN